MNALRHSHSRYPGMVNPSLTFVDNSLLIWNTIWSNTDGNYGYPGLSKSGYTPIIDYGDGTIEVFTGSHMYADGSTKTVKLSSTDGWAGVTELRLNWGKCTGALPIPELLTGLIKYVCDTNQFTGAIPSLSHCTLLEEFHVEGNLLTGSVPSFSACIALTYFNISNNIGLSGTLPSFNACVALQRFYANQVSGLSGALPSFAGCINLIELRCDDNTGITGSMPSFNACTLLEELHINIPQFTGVIPTFHACTHLAEVYIPMNMGTGFTGYTSGAFNNQANLYSLSFYGSSLPQADIDALLADLVSSLSLPSRVTCSVTLTGGSNASPSSMTNHDILEAAGWTVDVN